MLIWFDCMNPNIVVYKTLFMALYDVCEPTNNQTATISFSLPDSCTIFIDETHFIKNMPGTFPYIIRKTA